MTRTASNAFDSDRPVPECRWDHVPIVCVWMEPAWCSLLSLSLLSLDLYLCKAKRRRLEISDEGTN